MSEWKTWGVGAVLICAVGVGCAEPEEEDDADQDGADQMVSDDSDIPTVGDTNNGGAQDGCDPVGALSDAWPLQDKTSEGTITVTEDGGVWSATMDASAGGLMMSSSNAFLYLDLDEKQKVDVTDMSAVTQETSWELAFKRTSIFINGGDHGPGGVEIARLTGVNFDGVTSADIPAEEAFVTEESVDDACQVLAPPSGFGTVRTVFEQLNADTNSGSWFSYGVGMGAGGVTTIEAHVYIIRGTDAQKTYKFSFDSWTSGTYEVRWAEL
ncbi:MAG: HmuY family protein [Myxococcota bacterium]